MRKILILPLLLSLAGIASAQEATLNTPVSRPSETKIAIKEINIRQTQIMVSLSVQDASSNEVRYYNVTVPDSAPATASATVTGLVTAIDTVRATETGGVLRKLQFRVLGYLLDTGYLPGVTLQP